MNTIQDRTARAALTRLFEPGDIVGRVEPGDIVGRALVAKDGTHAALRIAIGARPAYPFWDVTAEELAEGLSRWAPRIHDLAPEKDLATIERLGGGFLIPDDEHWPAGLNDLPDVPTASRSFLRMEKASSWEYGTGIPLGICPARSWTRPAETRRRCHLGTYHTQEHFGRSFRRVRRPVT